VLCREPTIVRILLKDGRIMQVPFEDVSPIVLANGWVTILLAEEVHIAVDVTDGAVHNPRAIRRPDESQDTLSFRFSQDPKTGDSFLVVSSTVNQVIKFDLGMMLPGSERVRKTSSCPVPAREQLYEHWPYPILQFVAARFRVLPSGSPMNCE